MTARPQRVVEISAESVPISAAPPLTLIDAATWRQIFQPELANGQSIKRLIDVLVAVTLLVVLSPLILLAIVAVQMNSPGPALFVHYRVGWRSREFPMFKLRTMVDGAPRLEVTSASDRQRFLKLHRDPRVTTVGRVLRKYSIDELPQLLNVIRGEMSLVGPRPLVHEEVQRFRRKAELRRFAVRPGISGLWQVSGRNECDDDERMRLDLEYVDQWSLWQDFKIMIRTIPAITSARGAS